MVLYPDFYNIVNDILRKLILSVIVLVTVRLFNRYFCFKTGCKLLFTRYNDRHLSIVSTSSYHYTCCNESLLIFIHTDFNTTPNRRHRLVSKLVSIFLNNKRKIFPIISVYFILHFCSYYIYDVTLD